MEADLRSPLLLLDIDGVMLPFGDDTGGLDQVDVDGLVRPLAPAWRRLPELAEAFEIVWASSWERESNTLGARLQLVPKRWLEFDEDFAPGENRKLSAVTRAVGTRAFAWIDDEIDLPCLKWMRTLGEQPHLLITADPRVGLTDGAVGMLLNFARNATDGSWVRSIREARQRSDRRRAGAGGRPGSTGGAGRAEARPGSQDRDSVRKVDGG